MAFFALLWKARAIERYRLNYEKEKIKSIVVGNTQIEQTLTQRLRHYRYDTQKRISRTFKKWYPEGSRVANFFLYLKTDQTFPNFLLKSVMGFVGGIILTYLCFMFFVFQLSISLIHATIMSSIIGVLLTLGLAFSYRMRCLVFLLIPQFFSRVGRYTLTCYALVLILTGPATNTLKNSEVLSESMACTQEQIKTSVHQLDDLMKKPFNSMKYSIKLLTERYNMIAARMKQMVITLNRLLLSIVGFIQSSFAWLQSISNMCNAKLGSPYSRCTALLKDRIADCKEILGPGGSKFCNMAYLGQAVCSAVKPFKAYCYVTDFMDEAILASIRKKLKNFTAKIRALLNVKIHLHHSYSFSKNSTKTASQVAAGIVTEIRNRTGPLLTWLSWSSCVTSLFFLLIIFRAKYYQHMYETRSRFDNHYVTKELQELDLRRQRQGRETILPLNRRERAKYITATSFSLVNSEKVYLTRSAVFMAITTFKLLIHMVADYSLYWVLMTIRYHGKYQSSVMPGVPQSGAHVSGNSFSARFFRSIVESFNIPLSQPPPSLLPCLPDPYTPDFRRYTQIGVLIFLLWFFALFEPYGLRLRHVIMGQYRPERAKARASWLYNHILRTRAGFMKFARKKLHREYKYSSEASLTFMNWLNDHIPFQCLKYLLGITPQEPHCLLCGIRSSPNDIDTQLTRCETPKCPGVYCINCFSDIGQLCTICLSPADYGDLSDVSLEKGSSDDSDSGPEFYGNADDNTRQTSHMQYYHRLPRTNTSRRWSFFNRSFRSDVQDTAALMPGTEYEDKSIYTHCRKRKRLKNLNHNEQNKSSDNLLRDTDYKNVPDYYLDYNNNETPNILTVGKEATCKTRSIGIMAEEHHGILTKINFSRFIFFSSICVYKKQKEFPKPKSSNLKINNTGSTPLISKHDNIDESYEYRTSPYKLTNSYSSVTVQTNPKQPKMDNDNYLINTCQIVEGIIEAVKCSAHNNNQLDSKNKNNKDDSHKMGNKGKCDNTKPLDNNSPKENYTNGKITEGEKSKKPDKEKGRKVKIKTSRHKMGEFHTYVSKRWKIVKSNMVTSKQIKTADTVALKETKNHKRRKKQKDEISLEKEKPNNCRAKKDFNRTRNYRISAFLSDRDWMKRDYKKTNRTSKQKVDSFRVLGSGSRLVSINKNQLVAMVQLSSQPFQWREAPAKETRESPDRKDSFSESSNKFGLYRHNAKKALERFRHKVNTMISTPPSSFVMRMLSNMNVARKKSSHSDSSICLRGSFYRSFRNELQDQDSGILDTDILFRNQDYEADMPPMVSNTTPCDRTTHSKIGTSTSYPYVGSKLLTTNSSDTIPKLMKAVVARSCKCDPVKGGGNSMTCLPTDKTRAAKVPISVRVKNLCSSLFGSSCTDKTCPRKRVDEKKEKQQQFMCRCSDERTPGKDRKAAANADGDIGGTVDLSKCRAIELAKIKEIQRHIEKSKAIEKQLKLEQKRHNERKRQIELELGKEFARYRQQGKCIMDDDTGKKFPACVKMTDCKQDAGTQNSATKVKKEKPPKIKKIKEPKPKKVKQSKTKAIKEKPPVNKCNTCGRGDAMDPPKRRGGPCTCATQCSLEKKRKPMGKNGSSTFCARASHVQATVSSHSIISSPSLATSSSVPLIKHSTVCADASQTIAVAPVAKPKIFKDISVLVKLSGRDRKNTPRTCRGRDAATLVKILSAANYSPRYEKQSPQRKGPSSPLKWSPVNKERCPGRGKSTAHVKDVSTLVKPKLKKLLVQDKYASQPTPVESLDDYFLKPGDIYLQDLSNHSALNMFNKAFAKDYYADGEKLRNIPTKDDRKNERYRSDEHAPHREMHYDYHWRKRNKADTKYCPGRRGKLSLESTFIVGNRKQVNEILADTHSEASYSTTSIRGNKETKTETTLCSIATVDFFEKPRSKKYRIKIIRKANEATSTEKTKLCDMGTVTYDWWSPMMDKRREIMIPKKKGYNVIEKQRQTYDEVKRMNADGRIVKFKSRAQIIPGGMIEYNNDIMSPSRYLLESQKYYNELFAYSMYPPRGEYTYLRDDKDKNQSSITSRRGYQRRPKRLEECYSPRIQYSPKRRYTDSTRTSDSPKRRPYPYRRNENRHYLKMMSGRRYFY